MPDKPPNATAKTAKANREFLIALAWRTGAIANVARGTLRAAVIADDAATSQRPVSAPKSE